MNTIAKTFAILTAVLIAVSLVNFVWAAELPMQVNINTATPQELSQLKGVGPAYAAKIVTYRETNGPFSKPEDLVNVPGIGTKTYEANKDRIVVGNTVKKQ
jgi:competence protein ComEA